ncbi:transporter substrate-binding domain-containing protein [Azospirillum sp. ST 5-10]|uniref:transporter substrate-binding domain-containing protein n=1 Tax=unclassified Azospirillum TaxID=2630922 RepID=UPI003F49DDA6
MAQSGEPWTVGVLFSQTGVTGFVERTQLQGTLLAVEEINAAGGLLGRPIQPVIYDPGSEPEGFRRYATKLLAEDGVTVIFGCCTSRCRKPVLPLVERRNGVLFYPAIYEGFEYSPNVIYTGAAPNQSSVQLARFLTERYGKHFCFVGSDYVYPRESNRVMRELVEDHGGEVLDEIYIDIHAGREDFDPIARRIVARRPDVVFSTVVGESTAHLYEACAAAGLDAIRTPIASLTTSEAEVALMDRAAATGSITAAPYFQSVATPENQRFVAAFKRRFGPAATTNMSAEAAYFQVHLFARALAMTGSMDPDHLIPAVLGLQLNAPQGRVSVDPDNNHTFLWPRIGRVNGDGLFDIVEDAQQAVRPDPYLVSYRCIPA